MNGPEKVSFYCGEPINEMSRERLIEALENMAQLYHESLEEQKKILEIKYRFRFFL